MLHLVCETGADVGRPYNLLQDQHRGLELEGEGFHGRARGRTASILGGWVVVGGGDQPGHTRGGRTAGAPRKEPVGFGSGRDRPATDSRSRGWPPGGPQCLRGLG
eukprot:8949809-Pyramimonas_sp.AAC.1